MRLEYGDAVHRHDVGAGVPETMGLEYRLFPRGATRSGSHDQAATRCPSTQCADRRASCRQRSGRYGARVKLTNRKGLAITSLDDWAALGKPASADHWTPGRSAYELAGDWTESDADDAVVALLSSRPELAGSELLDGVAEKQTRFDEDPHGPRNHDVSSGKLVRYRRTGS
jgi:Domain of unknown function (DUF6946)